MHSIKPRSDWPVGVPAAVAANCLETPERLPKIARFFIDGLLAL